MAPPKRPATYADIEAIPEHLVGEIIEGELVVSRRPPPRSAYAAAALLHALYRGLRLDERVPGTWWILREPEVHLGAHVLVPDLVGWRSERLDLDPDAPHVDVVPDWVC